MLHLGEAVGKERPDLKAWYLKQCTAFGTPLPPPCHQEACNARNQQRQLPGLNIMAGWGYSDSHSRRAFRNCRGPSRKWCANIAWTLTKWKDNTVLVCKASSVSSYCACCPICVSLSVGHLPRVCPNLSLPSPAYPLIHFLRFCGGVVGSGSSETSYVSRMIASGSKGVNRPI